MTESDAAASGVAERLLCPHCSERVPPGTFCGHCGGHLADAAAPAWSTHAGYAAAPHEHVLGVGLVSTFFPHLPRSHAHPFRWVLGGGAAVVVLLIALHLYGLATLAAALVLPILYLLYLFEARVYEHEPLLVVGATFVIGAGLGVAEALVLGQRISDAASGSQSTLIALEVGAALLSQVLLVAGPLLLIGRRHFNEALDGLVFGVTSAFAFSAAVILTNYWPVITGQLVGDQSAVDWASRLVRTGLLVFIVNAAATGAITTTLWLRRHGRARTLHRSAWTSLPVAIVVALASQAALAAASVAVNDTLQLLGVWLLGTVLLVGYLRLAVHHALLAEGGDLEIGRPTVCPECHHVVPTMLFCPNCGVARSATPKSALPTVDAVAVTPA